jgi:hypothetical protein
MPGTRPWSPSHTDGRTVVVAFYYPHASNSFLSQPPRSPTMGRSDPSTRSLPPPPRVPPSAPPQRRAHWHTVLDTPSPSSSSSTATAPSSSPSSPHSPHARPPPPPLSLSRPRSHSQHHHQSYRMPSINGSDGGGPKSHPCPDPACDASFAQKSHANSHYRAVHQKIKMFACDQCPLSFNKRFDLTSHTEAVHAKARDHKCLQCGVAFAKKSNLTRHQVAIHSAGSSPPLPPPPPSLAASLGHPHQSRNSYGIPPPPPSRHGRSSHSSLSFASPTTSTLSSDSFVSSRRR